ncbi:MAG: glycosyltransferase [Anaerolineales bacterium]|nr:glycosyltransferase [Anaerolineales bacterium]
MRYCVVGPTYPFRGGIAHFTTLLVNRLRQRHAVRFFSYWRQYPGWLFPGNTERDPSDQILEEPCERTLDALNPLSWWRTARLILAERPDVVLLQWWTPYWLPLLLVIGLAARRARLPVLFYCHQLWEPDSPRLEWQLARLGLWLGDAYIVNSTAERRMLERAFPSRRIALGHLPVYDAFASKALSVAAARQVLGLPPPEVPVLLAFGFVRRYKGLRYLLQALAQVSGPAHLLIAGEFWEDEQEYHRLAAELGLTGRVTIHNRYVRNEEIEPYFAGANVLVLPYLSGSQSAVGMLAIHHALPIIATAVGGLAETVRDGENGLIVPPADAGALAGAIRRFLDEGLEAPMRAAAAQARQRLSWPALVAIIEEISHELAPAAGADTPVGADTGLQRS